MSSPFRELFVEVPQALLEAAVIEAQQRQAAASMTYMLKRAYSPAPGTVLDYLHVIMRRYGWVTAEAVKCQGARTTEIDATLECGHRMVYVINDESLWRADSRWNEIEVLDAAVDRTPRCCFCVQRDAS
jgi:hypothetical protein